MRSEMMSIPRALLLCMVALGQSGASAAGSEAIDLSRAVVVVPDGLSGAESKAARVFVEEVKTRTRIAFDLKIRWPEQKIPVIAVGPYRLLEAFAGIHKARVAAPPRESAKEGFQIRTIVGEAGAPIVLVVGDDARGVLFGVGRLLRELRLEPGKVTLDHPLDLATSPRYPLRGHQLGYRPKTNSYDAWDLPQWEKYIRELALFGTNAIELIPPRSDDDADSPHFPLPPLEMMVGMSRICDEYGLDVWIWYPAMDPDYTDARTVERALEEWAQVFKVLPRIDAVFVPGGDPGHTRPGPLLALLEKQTESLRRYHPKAQMWVSPQGFTQVWLDEFLKLLEAGPAWLSGIVYGPQVRVSLPELRKAVPAKYPIRDYPDITHSMRCQYGVPDWDVAFSLTEGREVINPRPVDESAIFHAFARHTIGFLTYSEGCNDDVNKIVWSALGWDPDADVVDILRQYARILVGLDAGAADAFALGLFALERNWRGPLLANTSVDTTLTQFQSLERSASPAVLLNWRFQQALYRAYYDAYQRKRLIHSTAVEEQALDKLRDARVLGSKIAMRTARAILEQGESEAVAPDLRARLFELAEALYQSIRMQLSVSKYKAIAIGRGTSQDTVDMALNNHGWLERRLDAVVPLSTEEARLKAIDAVLNWTNPGPGGFHDDLGDPLNRPHLAPGTSFDQDPAFLKGVLTGFDQHPAWRRSWCRHAGALYDRPVRMRYTGLDREATYKVRIVYTGDMFQAKIRLTANDAIEIHPLLLKPRDMTPLEFDIPGVATREGNLNLSWYCEPGRGGNGRGCQVAEVWLIRKAP
jgi:hypothetical protein